MKRRIDAELGRAAQLDAELRSFLSWRVVTVDGERPDRSLQQASVSDSKQLRNDSFSDLMPLLRSKLELADTDLLRIRKQRKQVDILLVYRLFSRM